MNRLHSKKTNTKVNFLKHRSTILKSALLLILALFMIISPVMAGSYGTTITQGETVFIGESGLDIGAAITSGGMIYNSISYYAPGSTPGVSAPLETLVVSDLHNFYVTSDTFTGKTGAWYVASTSTVAFYVEEASLSVSLFNNNTGKDISNLKAVTYDNIAIRINSNLDALFARVSGNPVQSGIDIYVETPQGATLTRLYRNSTTTVFDIVDLMSIHPTNTLYWIPTGTKETVWKLDPENYKTGTYKVYAQCNVNSMKNNLGTVTGVTQSEIETLKVEEDYVAITSGKESVIKDNDFSVTIAGASKTAYIIWLSGTKGYSNKTDYPPKFLPNQDDLGFMDQKTVDKLYYMNGTTIGQDIPYAADGVYNEWAVMAVTGLDGTIKVGLTTDSNTKTGKYTVRAQKLIYYTVLDSYLYDTVDVKVTEPDADPTISLNPGWNFISTPKKLEKGNDTAGVLFGSINSGGHSAMMYNASTKQWEIVKADTEIKPLDGIWIYNNNPEDADVSLNFDTNPLQTPPSKELKAGWNAVGFSSLIPATAKDTLVDVSGKWTKAIGWDSEKQIYETTIISGGSSIYSDTRDMNPAKAYWVWLKEDGTIAALS